MISLKDMPSTSQIFSAYASMTGSVMLVKTIANDLIPRPLRGYIYAWFRYLCKTKYSVLTLIIEETADMERNQVFDASEIYLSTKITGKTERLRVSKTPKEKNLTIKLEQGEKISDTFEGIKLHWSYISAEVERGHQQGSSAQQTRSEKRFFELTFDRRHMDHVLNSYLPFVLEKAKEMKDRGRVLKMYTLSCPPAYGHVKWDSINLEHPSTFDTLAMDHKLKKDIIEDLDRFLRRKEFYKRVGKAWKRGYLLYGPPGTGKSSMIAAMANYLKFDVYDLQLANVYRDSDLRRLLLTTTNRSILVIEDIDCSVDFPQRRLADSRKQPDVQLTLSGLLNFIDGLWSSCGDERIIVFTTNHKDRLDPALLRPGRMDMHIHLSYCTYDGFKLLASNYLRIGDMHRHFGEIEELLNETEVTPAQVAEELMKSEDADVVLEGLVNVLKRKKMEGSEIEDEAANNVGTYEAKRQKTGHQPKKVVRNRRKRATRRST